MSKYLGAADYWQEWCKAEKVSCGDPAWDWWGFRWAEFVADKRISALGRKGGRVRSEAKKASGKRNMEKARAAKQAKADIRCTSNPLSN